MIVIANLPIIWQDEKWKAHNGSFEPQYELTNNRLIFLNEIVEPGTEHNQGNMNNLINFDNADSFPDCVKITTFPSGKMLSEWRRKTNNVLIARLEFDFATMTRTTILYFSNGTEAHKRIVKTTFPTGQIKQEVSI